MGFGKRIDKPGGCRKAVREELVSRAVIMTVTDTIRVDLLDISKTGARLQGLNLPAPGQELIALLGRLEAFATVIWRDDDQCGIHFDVALSDRALATIESERQPATLASFGTEAILAASDWYNGLAR